MVPRLHHGNMGPRRENLTLSFHTMSIYHCTQCGTNYGPKGSCPSCGRIGSRVSEFKMEPPKTFEAEILAAHPESNPNNPRAHEHWDLAMKLVGERHEKAELVRLVNWLLQYRNTVVNELEAGRSIPNLIPPGMTLVDTADLEHLRTAYRNYRAETQRVAEAETLAKLATPNRVQPSEPWPRQ